MSSLNDNIKEIHRAFNELKQLNDTIDKIKDEINDISDSCDYYHHQMCENEDNRNEYYDKLNHYLILLDRKTKLLDHYQYTKDNIITNIEDDYNLIIHVRDSLIENYFQYDSVQGAYVKAKFNPQNRTQERIGLIDDFFNANSDNFYSIGLEIPTEFFGNSSSDSDDNANDHNMVYHNSRKETHTGSDTTQNTYTSNGYTYKMDSKGRIVYAEAESLKYVKNKSERKRVNTTNMNIGGADRYLLNAKGEILPADNGHLFACIFDGSPYRDNLVVMDRFINRSVYKRLENTWKAALTDKSRENVRISVNIHLTYTNDSMRPNCLMVNYIISDSKNKGQEEHFSITNDDVRQDEYTTYYDETDDNRLTLMTEQQSENSNTQEDDNNNTKIEQTYLNGSSVMNIQSSRSNNQKRDIQVSQDSGKENDFER